MNPINTKKTYTPNIVKHKYKSDISPNNIISPTATFLNEQNKLKQLQQYEENGNNNNNKMILPKSNYPPPKQLKQIILKIKRKIDDEPLKSIVIERPKKKALLDTFKNNLNLDNNNEENQQQYIDLMNHEFHEQYQKDMEIQNFYKTLNNGILNNNISNDKELKLFKFVTTLNESIINNNKIDSKVQERLEQLKGEVNSPKIFEKKKHFVEKKRKEIRYKQIAVNRSQFKSQEEKEFFKVHDVIELERTVIEDHSQRLNHLTREEEQLICNYKSMLVEDLTIVNNRPSSPSINRQQPFIKQEYVYDYYLVSKDNINDIIKDVDLMDVEHITLDAEEDDIFDDTNIDDGDDTSDDSENWYKEYPSDEDGSEIDQDDFNSINDDEEEDFYQQEEEDDYNTFTYNQYQDDDNNF